VFESDEAEAEYFLSQIRARRPASVAVQPKPQPPKFSTAIEVHQACLRLVDQYDVWYSRSQIAKRAWEMKKMFGQKIKFENLHELGMTAVVEYWSVGRMVPIFDKDDWQWNEYAIYKPKTSGAEMLIDLLQWLPAPVLDKLVPPFDGDYPEGVPYAVYNNEPYDIDDELERAYNAL